MSTSFTCILQELVERTPGARAAMFVARDGESVDQFSPLLADEDAKLWAAHFGVLLSLVQRCLHLFHFGEAVQVHVMHERLDVLLSPVSDGYFVCFSLAPGAHLATAFRELDRGVARLRLEM